MTVPRLCSKTACGRPAVATLTYVYAESQVVLGPLATFAEPHSYDMCGDHARRLTAPRGWEIVRLVDDFAEPAPEPDELVAIADAVRRREPAHRQGADQGADRDQASSVAALAREAPTRRTVVAAPPATTRPDETGGDRPRGRVGEVSAVEVGRRGHLRVLRDGLEEQPPEE